MIRSEEFVAAFYDAAKRSTQRLSPGWGLFCYLITPDGDRSSIVSVTPQGEEMLLCSGQTLGGRWCEVWVSVGQAILRLEAAPLNEDGAPAGRIGFRTSRE